MNGFNGLGLNIINILLLALFVHFMFAINIGYICLLPSFSPIAIVVLAVNPKITV